MRAPSMTIAIAATLGAGLISGAGEGPARAYVCPPTYAPHLDLAWAEGGAGFVASRRTVVMFALDGDCKHRFAVPSADLRVSAARKSEGPFDRVAIERRGKLFAWQPPAPGLWFLRVDRETAGRAPPASGGAIVVAYEPEDRVSARLTLSLAERLREGIALLPVVEPDGRRPEERTCCNWLMPYLFLPRPTRSGVIAIRLPRGRYLARESFIDRRSRTDDRPGALRRVELRTLTTGQSGILDVATGGDVRLTMHAIERLPRAPAD